MAWLWHRLRIRLQPASTLALAGVRTKAEAQLRRESIDQFITQMADRSTEKIAELVTFLDSWIIVDVRVNGKTRYLPTPGWNLEAALTRDSYETETEAAWQVAELGGNLRVCRSR